MDPGLTAALARLDGHDPFAVLGLATDATQQEVNRAYRRLAAKWHPDRWPPDSHTPAELATAKAAFARVQAAAGILRDPQSRASYADWSAAQDDAAAAGAGEPDPWDEEETAAWQDAWEESPASAMAAEDIAAMGALVPFRPLAVREILAAAVQLILGRAGQVFGVAATAALLCVLAQLWVHQGMDLDPLPYAAVIKTALCVAFALPTAATAIGILVMFTGDFIVWGDRLPELLPRTGSRLWCLFGITGASVVTMTICLATARLVSIGFALPAIAVCVLFALAVPVSVLEIVSIEEALGRAGVLVRYSPLRMATIAFLILGISVAVVVVTAIPFAVAGGWAVLDPIASLTTEQLLLRSGWLLLAGTFVLAWFPVGATLLYVDQLIRQEEMAEELAQAAQRRG